MSENQPFQLLPLISEEQIKNRVEKLADQIAADFGGFELLVIGLLTGSFIFMADTVRALHRRGIKTWIDFIRVESYGMESASNGKVEMKYPLSSPIESRHVLLVDDILDTGYTLQFVKKYVQQKNPKVLKTCVLLDKPSRRKVSIQPDYVGFQVPDAFIVGYGLDYQYQFRELPGLFIVSFENPKSGFTP